MNYFSKFKPFVLIALLIGVSALAGCATVSQGKYDYSEGWREAEVIEVVALSKIGRPSFFTCVRNASAYNLSADTQYVILKFRRMGRSARHAAPLRADQKWVAGDKVYAKVSDCTGEIVPRPH